MSQIPPQIDNPYSSSGTESAVVNPADSADLTVVDWLICILCSGIGCIVGIVRMIQGKKNGLKMMLISIGFAVLWSIVRVAIELSMNNQ